MRARLWCGVVIGMLAVGNGFGAFQLPPLPYAENALEPTLSARTMGFHYDKHHKGYVEALNKLIAVSELESMPLEEIIKVTTNSKDKDGPAIFNNAAQIWNHTFSGTA